MAENVQDSTLPFSPSKTAKYVGIGILGTLAIHLFPNAELSAPNEFLLLLGILLLVVYLSSLAWMTWEFFLPVFFHNSN